MKPPSLTSRVKFQRRAPATNDGAGNTLAPWSDLVTERAEIKTARGGEAVDAARLAGRGVFFVRVRANSVTRTLTAADRLQDLDAGRVLAIVSVETAGPRDAWVSLVCESGRADG